MNGKLIGTGDSSTVLLEPFMMGMARNTSANACWSTLSGFQFLNVPGVKVYECILHTVVQVKLLHAALQELGSRNLR